MQAEPVESPVSPLQGLKQWTHQLVESQRRLQQARDSLQAERDQLLAQHQELCAALQAHHADQAALIIQLGEISSARDSLQQERNSLQAERDQLSTQQQALETARNTLEQILHLANSKQEVSLTGKGKCRNCGSHRVITIDGAGQVSSFFASRVFGLKSASPANLFLDAHLCIDCLFLTHAAKLPEESIARLYKDYRKASYNRDRISLEPGYALIAEQIGQPDEMRRRTADLDEYIEELTSREIFAPGNISSALDWGGSTGDYMPTAIAEACHDIHTFDIMHSEIDESDICEDSNQPIRTHNISQGRIYDYIQFCHVLEHLQEPLNTLRHIATHHLKRGGYIYIEVPIEETMNEFALSLMLTPRTHYTVHEHINKYCLCSVKALVESAECLSILDLREDSTDVGWVLPGFNDNGSIKIIRCLCRRT